MADAAMTATAIIPSTGAIIIQGYAGETITAGLAVYQKAADSEYYKADVTTSAATAAVVGFALNGASNEQPIKIQTGGHMTCDNLVLTAVAGGVYMLSAAGEIAPSSDIAAADYNTVVGVATSATNLKIGINVSGVVFT